MRFCGGKGGFQKMVAVWGERTGAGACGGRRCTEKKTPCNTAPAQKSPKTKQKKSKGKEKRKKMGERKGMVDGHAANACEKVKRKILKNEPAKEKLRRNTRGGKKKNRKGGGTSL